MNKLKKLLFFTLLVFSVFTVLIPFLHTNVKAAGCFLAYDYDNDDSNWPWWPACDRFSPSQNPRGETPKQQWLRLCAGTPDCNPAWWDNNWPAEYQCYGDWYDVNCDASSAGQTFECRCNNIVTCPGASCSSNLTATCTDATHVGITWSTNSSYFTMDHVELKVDTNNDGSLDQTINLGSNSSGNYTYNVTEGKAYRYRIDVYRSNAGGGLTCSSSTLNRTCTNPNNPPNCSALTVSNSTPIQGDPITITATVTDPENNLNTVPFYYSRVSDYACSVNVPILGTPTKAGNNYTITLPTAGIAPGIYDVWAKGIDTLNSQCSGNPECLAGNNNCCGVANLRTCANCKTQITVKPRCNTSITMTPSNSCNVMTLTTSGIPTSHVNATNTISPASVNNCTWNNNNTVGSCAVVNKQTFTWTHNWDESVVVDGQPITTSGCTKAITVNNPTYITLACRDYTGSFPAQFVWGEPQTFTLSYGAQANQTYSKQTNTTSASFNCGAPSINGENQTFTCNTTPVFPNSVSLTHNWRETYSACPLLTRDCSKSFTAGMAAPDAFFLTTLGNYYSGGVLSQSRFPVSGAVSLADYSFFSKEYDAATPFKTTCGRNSFVCSKKGVVIKSAYQDRNSVLPDSWYSQLAEQVKSGPLETGITYQEDDNLSLSGNCEAKRIYLVKNNLTIDSNFVLANKTNGCLFIVGGDTNIGPNVTEIEAFIITNNFTTLSSNNPFKITGGVITTGTTQLLRNINTVNSIKPTTPSEVFEYEGARYLNIFKSVFSQSVNLPIRETQYILK